MSGPQRTRVRNAEVLFYPRQPGTDDASDMYVLDALGVRILVRHRKRDGGRMDTYVNIEARGGCVVEVNEGGENEYGQG